MKPTPHEVRVTFVMFSDALLDEAYIDATESLVELYQYAKQGVKIPYESWIRDRLPDHKTGIMKRVLRYVKNYEQDEVNRYAPLMIAALRHFGIDWPELNAVSKSLAADKKTLNESYSKNDAELYKDEIINALNKGDMDDLFETLAEFAWIPKTLVGDVTKLNRILELHKVQVMKALLSYMRELDYTGICYIMPEILGGLENTGIDWPELDVVSRSLSANNLKESDQFPTDLVDEFADYLVNSIEDSLKYGTVKSVMRDINNLQQNGRWPIVKDRVVELLSQHRDRVLAYLDSPIGSLLLIHICKLAKLGIDWPEFEQFVNSKKTEIIKFLLECFRDATENAVYVRDTIIKLNDCGIDWPELQIILKSAKQEIAKMRSLDESDMSLAELDDYMRIEQNFNRNEIYYALLLIDKNDFNVVKHPDIGQLLDDQQSNIKEFMLHRLDRKDIFEFIRIVDMLKSTRIGWAWPAELVEQKKREVVKLLLGLTLSPYIEHELILDLLWMLKKIGIDWPELSIIEKSVRRDMGPQ